MRFNTVRGPINIFPAPPHQVKTNGAPGWRYVQTNEHTFVASSRVAQTALKLSSTCTLLFPEQFLASYARGFGVMGEVGKGSKRYEPQSRSI